METGSFTHNGVVFHYECAGEGEKHVVLQHGLSDYGACWGDMISDLSENGYRVALMDARGHGRSGKPDVGYDLNTMTADLMALIRHLKLDRPVVIGHSMGASMTARAASSYPEELRAIVLIDPVFNDAINEDKSLGIDKRKKDLQDIKQMSHTEIRDYTIKKHPEWKDIYIEAYVMSKVFASENIFKIMDTVNQGWREDLEKIHCPAMLITADVEKGAIVTQDTSNWIHERYPEIEILHVPNVGHSSHRENYPLVFSRICDFLEMQFAST